MTVSSEVCRKDYVSTGTDTYPFTWKIYLKSDLDVYVSGVKKTIDIHYTIPDNDVGDPDGGNVIFTVGNIPANGAPILIISSLPLTQLTDYIEAGKFPAETHEIGLDRVVRISQQQKEKLGRALLFNVASLTSGIELPNLVAGKFIGWNASGDGMANYDPTTVTVPNIDYIGNYNDSLTEAIASIGATPKTLIIHKGISLTQADETPTTMHLWFLQEGKITLGAHNLSILGPMSGPISQRFDDSGAGSVSGLGNIKKIYPAWWGAVGDEVTDSLAACQSAVAAASHGDTLAFLLGRYKLSDLWTIDKAINIEGSSAMGPGEAYTTSGTCFVSDSNNGGIYFYNSSEKLYHMTIRNIMIDYSGTGSALKFKDCVYLHMSDSWIRPVGVGAVGIETEGNFTSNRFENVNIRGVTNAGKDGI